MKIGIITMAAGRVYREYAQRLLDSLHLFLPIHERTVIILGDDTTNHSSLAIRTLYIPPLPKPLNTLLRFHYIKQCDLSEFDLIYYIDADCEVVVPIGDEIFPDKQGQLCVVKHPWADKCGYGLGPDDFYERNPLSQAATSDPRNGIYYQGCFFGGYRDDFLTMVELLDKNVKLDLNNRIIAKWHDESHMNKYFIDNPPKELSPSYAYPGCDSYRGIFPAYIKHWNNAWDDK
jgi:hypothetical protein